MCIWDNGASPYRLLNLTLELECQILRTLDAGMYFCHSHAMTMAKIHKYQ